MQFWQRAFDALVGSVIGRPVRLSHKCVSPLVQTVKSHGESEIDRASKTATEWSIGGQASWPLRQSQSRAWPSWPATSNCWPSGEYCTDEAFSDWARGFTSSSGSP